MIEENKLLKKRYGKSMKPIKCTRAFVREMPFDHRNISTRSYILIDDIAKSRTHVNLYDGLAGAGFDAVACTYQLGSDKVLAKRLEGYVACDISECAIAVVIENHESRH